MNKKILIQVYSDLHIEFLKQIPEIQPVAKYLFLVGDICQLNHPLFFKFFDYCALRWEKIFYTPGNHEFYSGKKNYKQLNFEYELKFKERYTNIFYLNNKSVSLNDEIDIYGSIFWTDSCNSDLNDYREIKQFSEITKQNIPIDYNFIKKISDEDLKSISNYLNKSTKKTIVMTHFPPVQNGTSNPVYFNQSQNLKDYFAWNNILKELNLNNVPLWLSGHTHWSYDIMYNDDGNNNSNSNLNNTRLLSNQLGYTREIGFTNIVQDGVFEINL
jgi:predicted MPP superfamily phosphohydrolase